MLKVIVNLVNGEIAMAYLENHAVVSNWEKKVSLDHIDHDLEADMISAGDAVRTNPYHMRVEGELVYNGPVLTHPNTEQLLKEIQTINVPPPPDRHKYYVIKTPQDIGQLFRNYRVSLDGSKAIVKTRLPIPSDVVVLLEDQTSEQMRQYISDNLVEWELSE